MSARRRPTPGHSPDPVRITTAAAPLSDDIAARSRRYLIQMGVRLACFLGAVLIDHWTRWVLLAGAVVLPYVAVVLANAGRERSGSPIAQPDRPALTGPPDPTDRRAS